MGAVAIALLVLYVASRLWFVGRLPYFLDEGLYAQYAYQGAQSTHQLFISETIGKEPLQAWLAIVWQALGVGPLVAIRLVSVSAGLLTVGVVGLLGRRLGGTAVGLAAAALCVALPFFVVSDGVGIEEPLVTLIMAGALYLEVELARRPAIGTGVGLAAVLAAGVLTKQSAEAAVLLMPLSLLCFDWSSRGRRRRLAIWFAALALALVAVLAVEILMRSSGYWATGQAFLRMAPLVRPLGQVLSHPFATAAHAWTVFRPALSGYVTAPVGVVAVIGAVLAWRRARALTALMIVWTLAPLLAALTFTLVPYPRHVMYALPPVLVLTGYALVEVIRYLGRRVADVRVLAVLGTVLAAALLAPALWFDARVLAHPRTARYPGLDDVQYVTGVPAGGAWPEVVTAIRRHSPAGPVVVLAAQADPHIVRFLLSSDPRAPDNRYHVVTPEQPRAAWARFAIVDELPFRNLPALRLIAKHGFAVIGRYPRPRGGPVVTLYERAG